MAWHPEPKSLCWAWCQPETHGNTARPRDAAALPPNPGAHEYRNAKSLWGHKAFRLVPVIYLRPVGPGVGEMVLVQLEGSKVQIRTKPGLLLEWYEGLLVLDALMRSSEQCQWLESLAGRFQKERTQRKNLSASLYVSKKLLTIAVTGPQFVTREAGSMAHRCTKLLFKLMLKGRHVDMLAFLHGLPAQRNTFSEGLLSLLNPYH